MRIIDSFLFLGPHERELLLLKFILESPCVDHWVIVENHYTYRGQHKGAQVESILRSDPRFAPYLSRVTVCSVATSFCREQGGGLGGVVDPPAYAEAEWSLRDVPTAFLLDQYDDQDRVFVSDVDEMVDFTDGWRRDQIFEAFRRHEGAPIQFDRVRYWWDFDNLTKRQKGDIITPCYTIGNLRKGEARLRDKKWVGQLVEVPEDGARPTIFEYSFCFPYEGVLYKYSTSLHTHWSEQKIRDSILANHWTMADYQGKPDPNNRYHWFELVELTEKSSPKYVRENLTALKTNLVPDNYREHRLRLYNFTANFPER